MILDNGQYAKMVGQNFNANNKKLPIAKQNLKKKWLKNLHTDFLINSTQ